MFMSSIGGGLSIVVDSRHVLAFEDTVRYQVRAVHDVGSWARTGILAHRFTGPGRSSTSR